jgi:hypothetical protein
MSGGRKPRLRGSSHEVIGRALDAIGPRKIVADHLDVGTSKAAAWSDPDDTCNRAPMTFAQVRSVAREFPETAGAVFARDLASLAGGVFVPGVPDLGDCPLAGPLADAMREHSEAVCAIVAGLADGAMSTAESDTACRELDQAMGAMVALRAALDAHARRGLRQQEADHGR